MGWLQDVITNSRALWLVKSLCICQIRKGRLKDSAENKKVSFCQKKSIFWPKKSKFSFFRSVFCGQKWTLKSFTSNPTITTSSSGWALKPTRNGVHIIIILNKIIFHELKKKSISRLDFFLRKMDFLERLISSFIQGEECGHIWFGGDLHSGHTRASGRWGASKRLGWTHRHNTHFSR